MPLRRAPGESKTKCSTKIVREYEERADREGTSTAEGLLGIDILNFSVSRDKKSLDACPMFGIHTSDSVRTNAVSVESDQIDLALGTQFSVVRKHGVRAYPDRRAVSVPMLREFRSLDGTASPYNVDLAGVIFKAAAPEMSKKGKTWRKLSLTCGCR